MIQDTQITIQISAVFHFVVFVLFLIYPSRDLQMFSHRQLVVHTHTHHTHTHTHTQHMESFTKDLTFVCIKKHKQEEKMCTLSGWRDKKFCGIVDLCGSCS